MGIFFKTPNENDNENVNVNDNENDNENVNVNVIHFIHNIMHAQKLFFVRC